MAPFFLDYFQLRHPFHQAIWCSMRKNWRVKRAIFPWFVQESRLWNEQKGVFVKPNTAHSIFLRIYRMDRITKMCPACKQQISLVLNPLNLSKKTFRVGQKMKNIYCRITSSVAIQSQLAPIIGKIWSSSANRWAKWYWGDGFAR